MTDAVFIRIYAGSIFMNKKPPWLLVKIDMSTPLSKPQRESRQAPA